MPTDARPSSDDYAFALDVAVRAPSLHNTQPWHWTITETGLDLHADRERQLAVTDLDGHGLLLSCGAGLQFVRLGLAARGWECQTTRFPDPADRDLLARLDVGEQAAVTDQTRAQMAAATRRHSERRPFRPEPVPEATLEQVRDAAAEPGVYLDFVVRPDDRINLAVAVAWADRYERSDEGYLSELEEWTAKAGDTGEGIPSTVIPHRAGTEPRHTDVPMRQFEGGRTTGELSIAGDADEQPAYAVVFSTVDDSEARLRAGEALARTLVRAEELGLATSLISQPVDFPGVRERVRALMSWTDHPHMVLRVGWPPEGAAPPLTPRRAVADVTTDERR